MSNNVPFKLKKVIVRALIDGMSIRQIESLTGVHRDRIIALFQRTTDYCRDFTRGTVDTKNAELPPLCAERLKVATRESSAKSLKADGIAPITEINVVSVISFPTKMVLDYTVVEDDDATEIRRFLCRLGDWFHVPYVGDLEFHRYVEKQVTSNKKTVVDLLVDYICSVQDIPLFGHPPREESWRRVNAYTGLGTLSFFNSNNKSFPRSLETLHAVVAIYMLYYNYIRVHPLLDTTPAFMADVSDSTTEIDFIDMLGCEIDEGRYEKFKNDRFDTESRYRDE